MKHILVVDDSEVNLYLFQKIFENNINVQVDTESESSKALSRIQSDLPDLIFLDLMMPKKDGFQLLREIKSTPAISQIPIVIITAKLDARAHTKVMAYDIQGYITKPIHVNDIEEIVKRLLSFEQNKQM